jgi:16S rRNA (guanine(527)-N(7))-methyltransferase RsmG
MQSGNAASNPPPLPPELAKDFARFRSSLLNRGGERGDVAAFAESSIDGFREYGRLLFERAASLSLISKGDRTQIFARHILDSLNPVSLFPEPPGSAWDIGSGGGLPGIPLAIAWPSSKVTLLESRERKAGFLEQAVRGLRLGNVRVVCARLEDVQAAKREEASEAVFIRALGHLGEILIQCSRLVAGGATWVYFLGDRGAEEVLSADERRFWDAEVAIGAFGGRLLRGRFPDPSG